MRGIYEDHAPKDFVKSFFFIIAYGISGKDTVARKNLRSVEQQGYAGGGIVPPSGGINDAAVGNYFGRAEYGCDFTVGCVMQRVGVQRELLVDNFHGVIEYGKLCIYGVSSENG